ncbi:MAPEG family protein [Rhodobacteraceae bacterium D3-12]|nr:MAPEG family protein [Rhodobacteraceae bacterium D3-12]
MSFPVTSLFAALFAIVMLVLWINVTKTRAVQGISIGDGGDVALHEKVRRHGNFMEWVPMTLILLALAEAEGVAAAWLYAVGAMALAGRVIHPVGLRADNAAHPARIVGNMGNILAVLLLIGLLLWRVLA